LSHGNHNVEEYAHEFEKLVIKCDLQEPEEQTIVRCIGDLDPRHANVVDLQAYTTFDKVCALAYKVEQEKKSRQPPKPENPQPFSWNQQFNKGSFNPIPKPPTSPPSFPLRTQAPQKIQTLKIDPILSPWATEDVLGSKDFGTLLGLLSLSRDTSLTTTLVIKYFL